MVSWEIYIYMCIYLHICAYMYFRPRGLRLNTDTCSAVFWFKLDDLPVLPYVDWTTLSSLPYVPKDRGLAGGPTGSKPGIARAELLESSSWAPTRPCWNFRAAGAWSPHCTSTPARTIRGRPTLQATAVKEGPSTIDKTPLVDVSEKAGSAEKKEKGHSTWPYCSTCYPETLWPCYQSVSFIPWKKRAMFYLVKNTSSTPWYVTMSMSNIYGARERGGACLWHLSWSPGSAAQFEKCPTGSLAPPEDVTCKWSAQQGTALPWTYSSIHGRVGFFKGSYTFGMSLLVAFYTMLRTGESSHLLSESSRQQVLISLGLTKGGKRTGAAESVILGCEPIVRLVKHWKDIARSTTPLALSPGKWRGLFNESLCALGLEDYGFRPYSLRRGGATFWFSKHQSLDRILISGRWQTQKSARIYIHEGLSLLAGMNLPVASPNIRPFHKVYYCIFNPWMARRLGSAHRGWEWADFSLAWGLAQLVRSVSHGWGSVICFTFHYGSQMFWLVQRNLLRSGTKSGACVFIYIYI